MLWAATGSSSEAKEAHTVQWAPYNAIKSENLFAIVVSLMRELAIEYAGNLSLSLHYEL